MKNCKKIVVNKCEQYMWLEDLDTDKQDKVYWSEYIRASGSGFLNGWIKTDNTAYPAFSLRCGNYWELNPRNVWNYMFLRVMLILQIFRHFSKQHQLNEHQFQYFPDFVEQQIKLHDQTSNPTDFSRKQVLELHNLLRSWATGTTSSLGPRRCISWTSTGVTLTSMLTS